MYELQIILQWQTKIAIFFDSPGDSIDVEDSSYGNDNQELDGDWGIIQYQVSASNAWFLLQKVQEFVQIDPSCVIN